MTEIKWKGGMAFEGVLTTGQTLLMDAAEDHGGKNAGGRPMEILLAALGGCSGMDVVSILSKKRQAPESFRMEVEAVRRDDHPKTYTEVRVKYILKGKELTDEAVKRAVELSQGKYCSVAATLRGTAKVTFGCEIEK